MVYDVVLMMLNFFLTLPVTIAIISLWVYQISCVIENMTSIEDFTASRAKKVARTLGVVRHPASAFFPHLTCSS